MSTAQHRSREGCWTCRAKRQKCDKAQPACHNCETRGVSCEGYALRLRWGTGIASRGRFTGAEKPVEQSIPPRPKGRRRDLSRERRRRGLPRGNEKEDEDKEEGYLNQMSRTPRWSPADTSPSAPSTWTPRTAENEMLFEEFLSNGINILHATTIQESNNLLWNRLPMLCEQSDALYTICLAIQVSLTDQLKVRFFEYFDAALGKFRSALAQHVSIVCGTVSDTSTLTSKKQILHGLPWTMHLQGMYNILQTHELQGHVEHRTPFRSHLLEVMGVMDLPTFSVGRQNPCLGLWRRYCRETKHMTRNDVELVSGLPRSLIDLFSCIGHGATEEDFWDWPGAPGALLQCHLWEAYRLAGILTVRHRNLPPTLVCHTPCSQPPITSGCMASQTLRARCLPSTEVLVSRILSCVDAIRRASSDPEESSYLVMNSIIHPTFVAGLQIAIINARPDFKELISQCILSDVPGLINTTQGELVLDFLRGMWDCADEKVDVEELARLRGFELVLL
ncbi:C6 finger domain protein, putative [Talaromyces marneffei ATCC 18224]|uniref:C6 finger domain protein, putative n=1 Tax=Talaromyces marneffei (strain ATCC 18224 / CBS 334.59 / QM 7333) TaxID=441960 RepID=B6QH22_TALMQ|nr:C6 finger domain protein, putative [Talaromyces marneffei ATCC 18224]